MYKYILTPLSFLSLTVACSTSVKQSDQPRTPAATESASTAKLANLKVYEISNLEEVVINEVLKAGGLGQFKAQVRIVDPINDPQGALEAALKPIVGLLDAAGITKSNLHNFVPREVNYYTKKGHALIASCYLYLYQAKDVNDRVFVNSRQCNLIWKGVEQLEGALRISQYFSGVAAIDDTLRVTTAKFISDEQLQYSRIESYLRDMR